MKNLKWLVTQKFEQVDLIYGERAKAEGLSHGGAAGGGFTGGKHDYTDSLQEREHPALAAAQNEANDPA